LFHKQFYLPCHGSLQCLLPLPVTFSSEQAPSCSILGPQNL
jgi:hypothetical protein